MSEVFTTFHQLYKQRVNQHLSTLLNQVKAPNNLQQAMAYAVSNGGKRLRPVMVYAASQTTFHAQQTAQISAHQAAALLAATDDAAAAIELLHCYSLVHDDLPAMDDDDLRRGVPSCHIAFDEATAILTGDALQSLAFETLTKPSTTSAATTLTAEQKVSLLSGLAHAAGASGMVGGQVLDLAAVNTQASQQTLEAMHRAKTGALIIAALEMGGICAQATDEEITALRGFGANIGLAFQVVDDILDITSDTATLGKQQGADQQRDKPTYPALMGLEGAQQYANELCTKAKHYLSGLSGATESLHGLAEFVIERKS